MAKVEARHKKYSIKLLMGFLVIGLYFLLKWSGEARVTMIDYLVVVGAIKKNKSQGEPDGLICGTCPFFVFFLGRGRGI